MRKSEWPKKDDRKDYWFTLFLHLRLQFSNMIRTFRGENREKSKHSNIRLAIAGS